MVSTKIENKKAQGLMPDFLKVLLAVVCVVILLALAARIIGIMNEGAALRQAEASVDGIVGIANNLEAGEKREYVVEGPKNWRAFIFQGSQAEYPRTQECGENECLCFCESSCKNEGVCRPVEFSTFFSFGSEGFTLERVPLIIYIIKTEGNRIILTDNENLQQSNLSRGEINEILGEGFEIIK